MNSYSVHIISSWWIPALLFIFAMGLSWFSYRLTVPPISSRLKYLLIGLRTFALSILLLVLFEPVLTIINGSFQPPVLIVLLDNSVSASINDAKGSRKEQFNLAIRNSGILNLNKENIKLLTFDSDVSELTNYPDSMKHNGQMTDISKALKWVRDNSESQNIKSVLLLSDGAFNTGANPLYEAGKTGRSIYTIGIGDSLEQKDIAVQSVITNELIYFDNPVPVNINIKVNGYTSGEFKVSLLDNGNKIAEENIIINQGKTVYTSIFEYKPTSEGMHKLTAVTSALEGELTIKNNTNSEFVNVLRNKKSIAIFAGSPSPDVTFLKNSLSSDKGVTIKTFIQMQGSEFYGSKPTKQEIQEAGLLVFIGFPIQSTPPDILGILKEFLINGKPLLFISSLQTDYQKLRQFEEILPFSLISSNPREYLAIADFKPEALSNPILKVTGTDKDIGLWNQLPPVFRTETFVKIKPESEVLAGFKVNNVALKEPLILSRSFQDRKCLAVFGYGLYRWKMLGYASEISKGRTETPDLYDYFVQNSIRWLSTVQDKKNIIIKTTRKSYQTDEKVEFLAQIYDASYSPVENANIQIKISGGSQPAMLYLNSQGNGRYTGSFQGLTEGDYYFTGEVTALGKKLGSDKGRFSVGEVPLEYINSQMNVKLLKTISEKTGGKFYLPSNSGGFTDDLKQNPSFRERPFTQRTELSLWNFIWFLILAIALLSAEWFLRKRAGMV